MKRMKKLKLIPHSWQPEVLMSGTPAPNVSPGPSPGHGSRGGPLGMSPSPRAVGWRRDTGEAKMEQSRVVQEDKVEKLKDYFENIRLTPVKKVATGMCTCLY